MITVQKNMVTVYTLNIKNSNYNNVNFIPPDLEMYCKLIHNLKIK